jgi:hypothetical protein
MRLLSAVTRTLNGLIGGPLISSAANIGPDVFDQAGPIYQAVISGDPRRLKFAVDGTAHAWTSDFFQPQVEMARARSEDGGSLLTLLARTAATEKQALILSADREAGFAKTAKDLVVDYAVPDAVDGAGKGKSGRDYAQAAGLTSLVRAIDDAKTQMRHRLFDPHDGLPNRRLQKPTTL